MGRWNILKRADGWVLPLAGACVSRCALDWAFSLELEMDGEVTVLQLEAVAQLTDGTSTIALDVHDPGSFGPALHLLRDRVQASTVNTAGTLTLSFESGRTLRVPCASAVEAWGAVGPQGMRAVALPGGGVAVWQPSEPKVDKVDTVPPAKG